DAARSMSTVIAVRNLVKTYVVGEVEVKALRGVNLEVRQGEFLAVTGPSGSGKSTFMHIVGCLERATSGQYILDGQDVSTMSKDALAAVRNKKMGFVCLGFIRRPAAARGDRARAHQPPVNPAGGRADREPRHPHQHRSDGDLPAPQPRARHHHRPDHARAGHRRVRHPHGVVPRRAGGRRPRRHSAARCRERAGGAAGGGGRVGAAMSFLMILRIALKALNRNKMRTALTMLGMIIGVAAVITMVALGTGAQSSIEAQIQSAGTNMVMVSAGNFMAGGVRMGQGNAATLVPEDAAAIRQLPGVQYVAAGSNTRAQVVAGHLNWNTQIQGTDVDMPLIRSWPVLEGQFFTPQDVATASKVAVLGTVTRDQLFGSDVSPLGQIIRVSNQPF